MLKILVIFAIVILGLTVYVTIKNQDAAGHEIQDSSQSAKPPVSPNIQNDHPQENGDNSQRNHPGWYRIFVWPEGVTTWAIILTLIAIAWQSNETKKAAQAALFNAQAFINAERPWITVSVKEVIGPMGGFNVYLSNKGRTPAMIIGDYLGCASVKTISNLPDKAPYAPGSAIKDRIIIPGDNPLETWFTTTHLKQMLGHEFPESWDGQVFVFGKIVYRDLLTSSSSLMHETRWIGIYQRPVGELGDSILQLQGLGVPEEYERYT